MFQQLSEAMLPIYTRLETLNDVARQLLYFLDEQDDKNIWFSVRDATIGLYYHFLNNRLVFSDGTREVGVYINYSDIPPYTNRLEDFVWSCRITYKEDASVNRMELLQPSRSDEETRTKLKWEEDSFIGTTIPYQLVTELNKVVRNIESNRDR